MLATPEPHDVLHGPAGFTVTGTAQSTAHGGGSLQARVSEAFGHALPPNVGAACARLRCCEPVPHD
jgi:hypothetical protein